MYPPPPLSKLRPCPSYSRIKRAPPTLTSTDQRTAYWGFVADVELSPRSGIRQGDPLSPLRFDLITVLLIFDFRRLHVTVVVLLYADDILLALQGRGPQQVADLRAVLYVLQVFGYFSGLRGRTVRCACAV